MTTSDVVEAPRQVVCVVGAATAAEEVLKLWVEAMQADEQLRYFWSRANCGVVQQRQWARMVIAHALDNRLLTQQFVDRCNAAMGSPFLPTTLPKLAEVLRKVLREDTRTGPISVAVIEAASGLTPYGPTP